MESFTDIEGPVPILVLWLLVLLGLAATGLLALAFWFIRKKLKTAERTRTIEAVLSPLEIALERLNRLKASGEHLEADPFTVEVSEIVREYLEASLQIPAREQTTEEFLFSLQSLDQLPQALKEYMPEFLNQCDWVKFARQSLGLEQRHQLLKTAETVVDVTDSHIREEQAVSPSAPVAS